MDAEQLRRLVLEPWCPLCQRPHTYPLDPADAEQGHNLLPPLWTRCPELRPEGLEWSEQHQCWLLPLSRCDPKYAAALIRDPIARSLAKARTDVESDAQLRIALASANPTLALIGLAHRAKDQQEQGGG